MCIREHSSDIILNKNYIFKIVTVFYREIETVVPDDPKDVLLFLYILLPGSNSINVSDFCPHSRQIRIDRTRAELRTY